MSERIEQETEGTGIRSPAWFSIWNISKLLDTHLGPLPQ